MMVAALRGTLGEALERTLRDNWQHKRSGLVLYAQAKGAISTPPLRPDYDLSWFGPADVQQATSTWYAEGLAPATIQKRLSCLATLGVNVEGCKVHVPKQLKWHLPMERKEAVCHWIEEEADRKVVPYDLARYVRWTMVTGLRLEETLRLRREDFSKGYKDVKVPGTKTFYSHATLPLGKYAQMLASSQLLDAECKARKFIDSTYEELRAGWEEVRKHFGWQDDPTATLKALRRTAAYHLHVEQGMPLGLVQQYLRHSNMATTLEYLRLTGGYGTEEMRRYLK